MSYLVTQAQAEKLLENYEPFSTGTLTAQFEVNQWEHTSLYVVRSYGVMIATHFIRTNKSWVTSAKYSVTTSRHTNLVRKAWGLN